MLSLPPSGVGQVGILVLVLLLALVLVPLHLHLVLVLVLVLVPLRLHLGLVALHLHLVLVLFPSCTWHHCKQGSLNTGSVSPLTPGCPNVQLHRPRHLQQALLLVPFSLANLPGFLYIRPSSSRLPASFSPGHL